MLRKISQYWTRNTLTLEFHEAVFQSQMKRVREMLTEYPALAVSADKTGTQPIHLLNTCDAADMFDLLAAHGADVMARDNSGNTPLHCVIDTDAGLKLIAHGASVNAVNLRGLTPLMSIAEQPQHARAMAQTLIEAGAKLDLRDPQGRTALDIARAHTLADVHAVADAHGGDTRTLANSDSVQAIIDLLAAHDT